MGTSTARTAARAATACAVVTLGLGSAQAAMAGPGPGVVNVPCSATALANDIAGAVSGETLRLVKFCTYRLAAPLASISVDLTILGNEDTVERSYRSGTPDFSVFTVTSGASFVLSHVNIRNGNSSGIGVQSPIDSSGYGGAIYNEDGNLTVIGGTISGNTANIAGGGIDNLGEMSVRGVVFRGNHANFGGGGIATGFRQAVPTGESVRAPIQGPTTVAGSSFFGNSAEDGGAIYIQDSTAVLHSNFTSNTASRDGGGIYLENGSPGVLSGPDHHMNPADQIDGGSPVVTASGFYRNQAQEYGGGIYNDNAVVTVTGAGFRRNKADFGGGFYNNDVATVNGGTFAYNAAGTDGGGFYNNDQAIVNSSTFARNTAGRDGAGFYNEADATITGSQIFRNTAADDGGGIFNDGTTINLTDTAVTENQPDNCSPLDGVPGCTG
jgi:hypothetical protein